eukprot:1479100-Rhodomonas_salina.1
MIKTRIICFTLEKTGFAKKTEQQSSDCHPSHPSHPMHLSRRGLGLRGQHVRAAGLPLLLVAHEADVRGLDEEAHDLAAAE